MDDAAGCTAVSPWTGAGAVDGLRRLKKRAGPNKAKAEADDIISILQLADEQKLLNSSSIICSCKH